uniref:Uncharacterized protein n=3 Tax=Vespula TaxID=7451 RepID=A0A834P3R1_VESPE|nr:hypothetical protein H0235_006901 [Vespula pensylvanica]
MEARVSAGGGFEGASRVEPCTRWRESEMQGVCRRWRWWKCLGGSVSGSIIPEDAKGCSERLVSFEGACCGGGGTEGAVETEAELRERRYNGIEDHWLRLDKPGKSYSKSEPKDNERRCFWR